MKRLLYLLMLWPLAMVALNAQEYYQFRWNDQTLLSICNNEVHADPVLSLVGFGIGSRRGQMFEIEDAGQYKVKLKSVSAQRYIHRDGDNLILGDGNGANAEWHLIFSGRPFVTLADPDSKQILYKQSNGTLKMASGTLNPGIKNNADPEGNGNPIRLELTRYIPVFATKGTKAGQIDVSWKPIRKKGSNEYMQEYILHRNGIEIKRVTLTDEDADNPFFEEDKNVLPGELYTYTVSVKREVEALCGPAFDEPCHTYDIAKGLDQGFINPNGSISGTLLTEASQIPVRDADVRDILDQRTGSALRFEPGATPIIFPDKLVRGEVKPFTVEFWLKADQQDERIVPFSLGSMDIAFELDYASIEDHGVPKAARQINHMEEWNHYAFQVNVFSETTNTYLITIFQNGQELPSTAINYSLQGELELKLNKSLIGSYEIDELRIWERSLTAKEIKARHEHIIAGNEPDLLLYYRFDHEDIRQVYNQAKETMGQYTGYSESHLNWLGADAQPPKLVYGDDTNEFGKYRIGGVRVNRMGNRRFLKIQASKPNHNDIKARGEDFIIQNSTEGVEIERSLKTSDYEYDRAHFVDNSQLPAAGRVMYRVQNSGSAEILEYPVPTGKSLEVDGQQIVGVNPGIRTDQTGAFSISVPVGIHNISVYNPAFKSPVSLSTLYFDGENDYARLEEPLSLASDFALTGWIYPLDLDNHHFQSVLEYGALKLELVKLDGREKLVLYHNEQEVSVESSFSDDWTFFSLSYNDDANRLSLSVGEPGGIKQETLTIHDLDLSEKTFVLGSTLEDTDLVYLGDRLPWCEGWRERSNFVTRLMGCHREAAGSHFKGHMHLVELWNSDFNVEELASIRDGGDLTTFLPKLTFSFPFVKPVGEEEEVLRTVSLAAGARQYVLEVFGAKISSQEPHQYERENAFDYEAVGVYAEGQNHVINMIDPVTDLKFYNKTRYGIVGNINIPCRNDLGGWNIHVERTDILSPGFELDITGNEAFNNSNSVFEIAKLVPGHYVVTITNQQNSNLVLESDVIDLTKGWATYEFKYRSKLDVEIELYPWNIEQGTAGDKLTALNGSNKLEVRKGQTYLAMVTAFESYGDSRCPVPNAQVLLDGDLIDVLHQNILSNQDDALSLETNDEGKVGWIFTASKPNFISPYTRTIQAVALHDNRVASVSLETYCTGFVYQNTNFAIEDPEISTVLHDPPGDNSSTSLSEGFSFSHQYNFSEGTDIQINGEFLGGFVKKVNWLKGSPFAAIIMTLSEKEASLGVISNNAFNYANSGGNGFEYTLGTTISTSSGGSITGVDADVFVGIGKVVKFGTGKRLSIDPETHIPVVEDTVDGNSIEIKRPFVYTHQDIKDIIIVQLEKRLGDLDQQQYPDSALNYQYQIAKWRSILESNVEKRTKYFDIQPGFDGLKEKVAANKLSHINADFQNIEGIFDNISFSGLTSQSFNYLYKDSEQNGHSVGGSSVIGFREAFKFSSPVFKIEFKFEQFVKGYRNNTWNDVHSDATGINFTLSDSDAGDHFNISIKKDGQYGTPIFRTNAGQSMCPFETGTQPREGVELISDQYDVYTSVGSPAVYNLEIKNTQVAPDYTPKRYFIAQGRASNHGAVIRYNGDPLGNGLALDFNLDNSSPTGVQEKITGQLTFMASGHGAGDQHFEDVPIVVYSGCEANGFDYLYHLEEYEEVGILPVDTVYLSAHFYAPCVSEITFDSPTDDWVVNSTHKDTLNLVFHIPGLTATDIPGNLTGVRVEYGLPGNSEARLLSEISLEELQQHVHVGDNNNVHFELPVDGLPDGQYRIRLVPQCGIGNESWRRNNPTPWIYGSIFRLPPIITEVYPEEDGVLTSGTIAASYDRPLNHTQVNSLNVSLRGVLGGLDYVPKSVSFDHVDDLLLVPDQAALYLPEAFSIEFWVRPTSFVYDPSVPIISKGDDLQISLTVDGKVDNGYALSATPLSLLNWTHVAIVYDGTETIKTYFDGTEVASTTQPGMGWTTNSDPLQVGAKVGDKAFLGGIDELRIWSKALSSAEIITNRESRLFGNEKDLRAYYVMDDIALIINDYQEGLRDFTGNTLRTEAHNISWIEGEGAAAPIEVKKVIQDIPIDVLLSGETEVLIIPKSSFPAYYLEGARLTAFIKEDAISDVYGNPGPGKSWTFLVNRNSVQWEKNNLIIDQVAGISSHFKMALSNQGATNSTYQFEHLPPWLDVVKDPGSGTLPFGFTYNMEFEVAGWLSPGRYEDYVRVVVYGSSGERLGVESFFVEVKVRCKEPGYEFNPNQFSDQMNISARLNIDGEYSQDRYDKVYAIANDTVRGIGEIEWINNQYMVQMTVHGNRNGDELEFRVWDSSECREYFDISESIIFDPNASHGNPSNPIDFTTTSVVTKSISLEQGYHWISFNLKDSDMNHLSREQIKVANKDGEAEMTLTSQYGSKILFTPGDGWSDHSDNVQSMTALDFRQHYLVYLPEAATITFTGESVNLNIDIGLPGNNITWVSYLPEYIQTVDDAMLSLRNTTLQNGDQILGMDGFAEYLNGSWIGSLTHLYPNQGYKLNLAVNGELNYTGLANGNVARWSDLGEYAISPDVEAPIMKIVDEAKRLGWGSQYAMYSSTMYVTGIVDMIYGENMESKIIGAFVDDESRGVGIPQMINGQWYLFMVINGENRGEEIKFRLIDQSTHEQVLLENKMSFQAGSSLGTYDHPYEWLIPENNQYSLSNYPNPFNESTTIEYALPETEYVELVIRDMNGRVVNTLFKGTQIEGTHTLKWKPSWLNGTGLSSGLYIISLRTRSQSLFRKAIIKN